MNKKIDAHSSKPDRRVSSAAVILHDTSGRALIVKAIYKNYWTFPGGLIDAGETPKEAAIREVKEEVGLTLDPEALAFQMVVTRKSEALQTYQFVFRASLSGGQLRLQAAEIEGYAFIAKADVTQANRPYGAVVDYWAANYAGYMEQELTPDVDPWLIQYLQR